MIYVFVFEGELLEGSIPNDESGRMLTSRLVESAPIAILDD